MKRRIMKLLCRLSIHKLSKWEPDNFERKMCKQYRNCTRPYCFYKEERQMAPEHHLSEWKYLHLKSCYQIRVCENCGGFVESRDEHQYGDLKYVTDSRCEQVKICQRCGEEEQSVFHQFGDWKSDSKCLKTRTCARCGYDELEGTSIAHQFDMWAYTTSKKCEQIRNCNICGFREIRLKHDWVWVSKEERTISVLGDSNLFTTYKCSRCQQLTTTTDIDPPR
jgi:hypothetical protein